MQAVAGQFVKFDAVPTRKVVRVVLEMPIEHANATLEKLGGYPDAANARWVGVALLKGEPAENTLKGGKMAQRAGILCDEGGFLAFAAEKYGKDAKQLIYDFCGVSSRAYLDHDESAASKFRELTLEYDAWRLVA